MEKERVTTLTDYVADWQTTCSMDEAQIATYCQDVLSTNSTLEDFEEEEDFRKQPLYTYEQMMEMFRLGYKAMSNTDAGKIIVKERLKEWRRPYTRLRYLKKGEKITFPYDAWGTVRVAASRLKKDFGALFKIRKLAPNKEKGDIEATRIK